MSRKLTLDDIVEQRAYERERDGFRQHVIALKSRRRVGVGPLITFLFENRDTIRFQIQEMARVERLATDEEIHAELDAYNPLIPEPGQLRATMFIELTSDEQMREWLPKLVGIERHAVLELADGSSVRCTVDAQHESQLTRDTETAAVHYLGWEFSDAQITALAQGATLVVDHPAYTERTALGAETIAELGADLAGDA